MFHGPLETWNDGKGRRKEEEGSLWRMLVVAGGSPVCHSMQPMGLTRRHGREGGTRAAVGQERRWMVAIEQEDESNCDFENGRCGLQGMHPRA